MMTQNKKGIMHSGTTPSSTALRFSHFRQRQSIKSYIDNRGASAMMNDTAYTTLQGAAPPAQLERTMGSHGKRLSPNYQGSTLTAPFAMVASPNLAPAENSAKSMTDRLSHQRVHESIGGRMNERLFHVDGALSAPHLCNDMRSFVSMKAAAAKPLFRQVVAVPWNTTESARVTDASWMLPSRLFMNAERRSVDMNHVPNACMSLTKVEYAAHWKKSGHLHLDNSYQQNNGRGVELVHGSGGQSTMSGSSVDTMSSATAAAMLLYAAQMQRSEQSNVQYSLRPQSNSGAPGAYERLKDAKMMFVPLSGRYGSVPGGSTFGQHRPDKRSNAELLDPASALQSAESCMRSMSFLSSVAQNSSYDTDTMRRNAITRVQPLCLPAVLSSSTDTFKLLPIQILLRQQIEAFQATEEDVTTHVRGRNKTVRIGQVGLRCRHCACKPAMFKGKGAVYFPSSVRGFYQAAQNMCSTHFQNDACRSVPDSIQTSFATLKLHKSLHSGAGRAYWATEAQKMGLVDMKEGVFFVCDLPKDVSLPDITEESKVYSTQPSKKRKVQDDCA